MVRPSRRRVLRMLAVIAGGGFLAGCTEFGSTDDDTAQSPSTKSETVELLHTESIVSDGLSHSSDDHRRHHALIVANADSVDEFSLEHAEYTDTDAAVEDATRFVHETDFDDEILLLVQSWIPTPCYSLRLQSITQQNEQLNAEFVREDVKQVCTEAEVISARFVRVSHNVTGIPKAVTVTITDAAGEQLSRFNSSDVRAGEHRSDSPDVVQDK